MSSNKPNKPQCERDEYTIGSEGGSFPSYHVGDMSENYQMEVDASDVNLDSFRKMRGLEPKLWKGGKLDSRARLKLLDIADDFWEFAGIDWVRPCGIFLTGSICSYNWSKYSDIDLHLVVEFSEIGDRHDFVREYVNGKKTEWNDSHKDLSIYGYNVEVYVEDIDDNTVSNGIYDLEANEWKIKPFKSNVKQIGLDKYAIKDAAAEIMTSIDGFIEDADSTDDDVRLKDISSQLQKLLMKVHKWRRRGLEREGEFSLSNIVYKVLRRSGYIEKAWNLVDELYDRINSLDESYKRRGGLMLEYLDKQHNMPLYDYFRKWANSSPNEKLQSIFSVSPIAIKPTLEDMGLYGKLRKRMPSGYNSQNYKEYVAFAAELCRGREDEATETFEEYSEENLPTWTYFDCNSARVVKNEWCVRFGDHGADIAKEGYIYGTANINDLGCTKGQCKRGAGYNFAYPLDCINDAFEKYSDKAAVIFQTSGVEVYHIFDREKQVIFWGENAKNFIPMRKENGEWQVYSIKNGRTLYGHADARVVAKWATENWRQYQNAISLGKG